LCMTGMAPSGPGAKETPMSKISWGKTAPRILKTKLTGLLRARAPRPEERIIIGGGGQILAGKKGEKGRESHQFRIANGARRYDIVGTGGTLRSGIRDSASDRERRKSAFERAVIKGYSVSKPDEISEPRGSVGTGI